MALSDAEVEKQINHMKKFIEQEAQEKAEEIMIKCMQNQELAPMSPDPFCERRDLEAEEEFNIEKGRLLQNEKRKVATFFERREKQLELQRKIQHSNLLNQARLTVLKSRDDHVKRIVEEAKTRLDDITRDDKKWKKVLQDLITQGLYQLLETSLVIRTRRADVANVKAVLQDARKAYKDGTQKDVTLVVDEQEFLPSEGAHGVELLAKQGKIKVVNTLESRLDLIAGQMLPDMRTILFGANPSRHFLD